MSPDPTLITFCVIVAVFTAVCWTRLAIRLKARAKERELVNAWWADRERSRAQAEATRLPYLVETYRSRPSDETSSLLDDSPGSLPDEWPARTDRSDSGPRAA